MSTTSLVERPTSSEVVYYTNPVPVKYLFGVNNDTVKNYKDLFNSFEDSISYIKELEKNGWEYDWEQSDQWLHFSHTDRNVAIAELGIDTVLEQEQNWADNEEDND